MKRRRTEEEREKWGEERKRKGGRGIPETLWCDVCSWAALRSAPLHHCHCVALLGNLMYAGSRAIKPSRLSQLADFRLTSCHKELPQTNAELERLAWIALAGWGSSTGRSTRPGLWAARKVMGQLMQLNWWRGTWMTQFNYIPIKRHSNLKYIQPSNATMCSFINLKSTVCFDS